MFAALSFCAISYAFNVVNFKISQILEKTFYRGYVCLAEEVKHNSKQSKANRKTSIKVLDGMYRWQRFRSTALA